MSRLLSRIAGRRAPSRTHPLPRSLPRSSFLSLTLSHAPSRRLTTPPLPSSVRCCSSFERSAALRRPSSNAKNALSYSPWQDEERSDRRVKNEIVKETSEGRCCRQGGKKGQKKGEAFCKMRRARAPLLDTCPSLFSLSSPFCSFASRYHSGAKTSCRMSLTLTPGRSIVFFSSAARIFCFIFHRCCAAV